MTEKYYSVSEVAAMFPGRLKGTRASVKTVRKWIASGRLKAAKIGRTVIISQTQINDFLLDNETE